MLRARMLRPAFWDDPALGGFSAQARLLMLATYTFADDEGLLRWDAGIFKENIFGTDDTVNVVDVHALMGLLTGAGLIFPYIVSSLPYGFIVSFHQEQKFARPKRSKLPAPPLADPSVVSMYLRRDGWVCAACAGLIRVGEAELDPWAVQGGAGTSEGLGGVVSGRRADLVSGGVHPSNVASFHAVCVAEKASWRGPGTVPPSGQTSEQTSEQWSPKTGLVLTEDTLRPLSEDSVSISSRLDNTTGVESEPIVPQPTSAPHLTCDNTTKVVLTEETQRPLTEDSLRAHGGKGKERKGKEEETNGDCVAVTHPPQTLKTGKTTSTSTASRRPSTAASPPSGNEPSPSPSNHLPEQSGTTKASQDDKTTGTAVQAALTTLTSSTATTNHNLTPQPDRNTTSPSGPPVGPATLSEEDPMEQVSLFEGDPAFAPPPPPVKPAKPVKAAKAPNPYYPAAQQIMEPWWVQFENTQMLPYGRVLKTVLTALEHGISVEALRTALSAIGHDRKPVTPGTIQMAISNLDKAAATGMGRPVNYVAPGIAEEVTYSTSFG